MDQDVRGLSARLVSGPLFLLWGQGSVSLEARRCRPVLEDPNTLTSENYQKYDAACAESRLDSADRVLVAVPWNGVFTSKIDSSVASYFAAEWRRSISVTRSSVGRFPRSSTELQIRFMFGGLGLQDSELPPRDVLEVVKWENNAATLLDYLASPLITPRGTLVIDGWDESDWITPQMLFVATQKLQPGQAHLFSVSEQICSNPFVDAAVKAGQLSLYSEPFGVVADEAAEEGYLNFEAASTKTAGKTIPLGKDFAQLDISTWNRVTSSVRPIDVSLLEPFTRASSEVTYQRFRNFMGAAEGTPPWKAVASGYHFERQFHHKLRDLVVSALDDSEKNSIIILSGQTATGKSIACTALAVEIARSGIAPVLYQAKRGDRPQLDDIEAFIEWAEARQAPPTVLIWDGMADPDEYYSLGRQLRSRGRRIVVVGTTYVNHKTPSPILAPATIGTHERPAFRKWLEITE